MKKFLVIAVLAFVFINVRAQSDPLKAFASSWAADSCGCSGWRNSQVSYDSYDGSILVAGMTFLDMDYGMVLRVFGKPQIFHKVNESTAVYCYTLYDYSSCGNVNNGWKNLKFTITNGIVTNIEIVYLVHEYGGTASVDVQANNG